MIAELDSATLDANSRPQRPCAVGESVCMASRGTAENAPSLARLPPEAADARERGEIISIAI